MKKPTEENKRSGQQLSPRELEILTNLAHGITNIEVTLRLKMSLATLKTHMKSILRKLEASNKAHAVAIAIDKKMIVLSIPTERGIFKASDTMVSEWNKESTQQK